MIQRFKGDAIPAECSKLTLTYGVMGIWLETDKANLRASVLMLPNAEGALEAAAWCCLREVEPNTFEVGTFTRFDVRQKGHGTKVLEDAMRSLLETNPQALIRYGGCIYRAFYSTYTRMIEAHGHRAENYFG